MNLFTPIMQISPVGRTTASRLKRLGINTVGDLLFYYPFRYDDFSKSCKIDQLQAGDRVNIIGIIETIESKRTWQKRMYIAEAMVSDDTGVVKVIWFNQPYIAKNLKQGDRVSLSGKVDNKNGLFMSSPVYEKLTLRAIHTQGLVPNYHLTANITQKQLRFLIGQIIGLADKIEDWLPYNIKKEYKLIDLGKALAKIHFPKNQTDIDQSKIRLSFNELFLLQLQVQLVKNKLKNCDALAIKFLEKPTKEFVKSLPFKLTDDQRYAAWEILQSIQSDRPTTRLLEGDVGSGKTVVALLALFNTAKNGLQSALMVPTEILAKQHFESISELLKEFDIKIGLLTRSNRLIDNREEITKQKMHEIIEKGEIQIIIGTHALIQEQVIYKNLCLVVIDEQHRFGVGQRRDLVAKAGDKDIMPHLLSMTATPIPRSLALALYDDLDISIIKQMPKDRQKIITQIITEDNRNAIYEFIRNEVKKERQVFVICPLIDWSDKLGVKSVKEEYDKLSQKVFPDLKIGMIHGKLKPKEKNQIMEDFAANKINILVSTSVIEVGIDVPNASVMMIEDADRFGLAQLHQYRGRVGRGKYQSYCFLLSEKKNPRLDAMTVYDNGFDLAKIDLKFRGPGDVYGTLQKGFPELEIASLHDFDLMKQAKQSAKSIVNNLENFPKIKEKLGEWESFTHLE
ncbi:MAG: ATP-dependent DNA helicase RecG [bacterium]